MKMAKVLKDFKNDLMQRREVTLIVPAEKSLGFEEAVKNVSEHFKADSETIAIKKVIGKFGRKDFAIVACIYSSKDAKEKTEPKPKPKKTGEQVAVPAEGAGKK